MNWLKDKIDSSDILKGIWLSTGSHVAAEIAGQAGFDWALIDLEHGLAGDMDALRLLQVLSTTPAAGVVRVPSSDSELIGRVLDFGASAIMAPTINNAEAAECFVRALRYPPEGERGLTASSRASDYGYDFKNYFRDANSKIVGIAQIETAVAVEQADQIAAVPGIDILFIGHSDLSLDLGCFGSFESKEMQMAEEQVINACMRHNKIPGMLLKSSMSVDAFQERGFKFFGLGSDLGCLKEGYKKMLEK